MARRWSRTAITAGSAAKLRRVCRSVVNRSVRSAPIPWSTRASSVEACFAWKPLWRWRTDGLDGARIPYDRFSTAKFNQDPGNGDGWRERTEIPRTLRERDGGLDKKPRHDQKRTLGGGRVTCAINLAGRPSVFNSPTLNSYPRRVVTPWASPGECKNRFPSPRILTAAGGSKRV